MRASERALEALRVAVAMERESQAFSSAAAGTRGQMCTRMYLILAHDDMTHIDT